MQRSAGPLGPIGRSDIARIPARAHAASRRIPFLATPAVSAASIARRGEGGSRGAALAGGPAFRTPAPESPRGQGHRAALCQVSSRTDPRVSEPGAAVSALQHHLGFVGLAHSGVPANGSAAALLTQRRRAAATPTSTTRTATIKEIK